MRFAVLVLALASSACATKHTITSAVSHKDEMFVVSTKERSCVFFTCEFRQTVNKCDTAGGKLTCKEVPVSLPE
jgi:hypothetical protein